MLHVDLEKILPSRLGIWMGVSFVAGRFRINHYPNILGIDGGV